jgi:hypothetical protein
VFKSVFSPSHLILKNRPKILHPVSIGRDPQTRLKKNIISAKRGVLQSEKAMLSDGVGEIDDDLNSLEW